RDPDVADDPRQSRNQLRTLDAPDGVDRAMGVGGGHDAITSSFDRAAQGPLSGRLLWDDTRMALDVYLIDGTYELFRHFYAMPPARDADGREVAAVRGVLLSVLGMINSGIRYVGVATDHVIESFRNRLWAGYKTGDGIDPALLGQFQLLEDTLSAFGVAVWPMVEYEADDALASAAAIAARDARVDRVVIRTPDKDLAQCVSGTRVVQLNRRTRETRDEDGVVRKFGV